MLKLSLNFNQALTQGNPGDLVTINLQVGSRHLPIQITRADLKVLADEATVPNLELHALHGTEQIQIRVTGKRTVKGSRVRIHGAGVVAGTELARRVGQGQHWDGWRNRHSLA